MKTSTNLRYQLYKLDNENEVNAIIKDETVWLTQKSMSELLDVNIPSISRHLKNIFESGELEEKRTVSKNEIVQKEGKRNVTREVVLYNLDAIISVGYRVNSLKATRFRQWATSILKEYMTKGFVLDDDRLKQGEQVFGKDYFRELLERVRSIRTSERRIWLQLTDIFAELSVDYDKDSPKTSQFYAKIQNKFHFAITGHTAAEIIYNTADRDKENMGLTTWKNSPDGRILKRDVTVAKNYLSEEDIKDLEREVSAFFDYIERMIKREKIFEMEDFASSIDKFLTFNEYEILDDKGRISAKQAKDKAHGEYDEFNKTQAINSDFEKVVKQLTSESRARR